MGVIPDPQQLSYRNKLTTNYHLDSTNQEELTEELNQMNQSIAEMVRAIEELNSQLEDYVRTLNDTIGRFRQIVRPLESSEVNVESTQDEDCHERIQAELKCQESECKQIEDDLDPAFYALTQVTSYSHKNIQIKGEISKDLNCIDSKEGNAQNSSNKQGFLSKVFDFICGGVVEVIDVRFISG